MFMKVKIQLFAKTGWFGYCSNINLSICRGKSCAFLAFRTSKVLWASCSGSKGWCRFSPSARVPSRSSCVPENGVSGWGAALLKDRTSTFWTQSRLYVLREEHSINWAKLQRASVGTLGRPPNSERASHHAHPFPKHGFEGTLDVSALQMTTVQRTSELRDLIRPLRMRRKGWESLER